MEYLLGIDLGTSYFKFCLVDRAGTLKTLSRVRVPASEPLPGRREVEAKEFWRAVAAGIGRLGAVPREIRAVSYSSQANSFILLDRRDRPLTPIILWSDRRVEEAGGELLELWGRADYLATSGMAVSGPEMAAAKIAWIRQTQPELFKEAARVLTISDYLTYGITGEAAGDESTGGFLGLRDVRSSRWWPEALAATGLREGQMAALLRSGTLAGKTVGAMAGKIGLPPDASFSVGSLDHYAAAVGSGLGVYGETSESTGTVLACLRLHPDYRPDPAYCIGPAAEEGSWYRLAFGPNGAGSLEWLQEHLAGATAIEELARLAAASPPGANGLYAPEAAYTYRDLSCFFESPGRAGRTGPAAAGGVSAPLGTAMETPDEIGSAGTAARPANGPVRGSLQSGSGRSGGDYARAVMESTARSLRALLHAVCPGRLPAHLLSTGGGARSDTWLQIKADMLGLEVSAASHPESGALGAAAFAALGGGWHRTLGEAVGSLVSIERRFVPDPATERFYRSWNRHHPPARAGF